MWASGDQLAAAVTGNKIRARPERRFPELCLPNKRPLTGPHPTRIMADTGGSKKRPAPDDQDEEMDDWYVYLVVYRLAFGSW